MTSENKKKTVAAWKKRNKKSIACVVYKEDAEKFAAYCAGRGQSVNENLKEYIAGCIGPLERRDGQQKKAPAALNDQYNDEMPE